jgi:hypothetical protein
LPSARFFPTGAGFWPAFLVRGVIYRNRMTLLNGLIRFGAGLGLEWFRLLSLGPGRTGARWFGPGWFGPRWFDDSSGLVGGT